MKLQLLQAGYTSFTGRLSTVQFAGGISVHDVDPSAAAGLAALFRIQWTDGAATPTVSPVDMTDPTNQFLGNGVDAVSAAVAAGVGQTTAQVVAAGKAALAPSSNSAVTTYSKKYLAQDQTTAHTGTQYTPGAGAGTHYVDITGVH